MDLLRCEEKLKILLDKYNVPYDALRFENDGQPALQIKDISIPLLPWRAERRFSSLRDLLKSEQSGSPCVMRVLRIVAKDSPLEEEIIRELDLCCWVLDSEARSIFMVQNGRAVNLVLEFENKTVATIEIAATLPQGADAIDRHEINTTRGVLCDRVVDTQVPQHSIYQISQNGTEVWTDTDFELYGLPDTEIFAIRNAFHVLRSSAAQAQTTQAKKLSALCVLAKQSAAEKRPVPVL